MSRDSPRNFGSKRRLPWALVPKAQWPKIADARRKHASKHSRGGYTSSTARGSGGSFKNRKGIGEIGGGEHGRQSKTDKLSN